MNKANKLFFATILLVAFLTGGSVAPSYAVSSQEHTVVTGAKILVYVGDAYHNDPFNFEKVYTVGGNTVMIGNSSYDFSTQLSTDNWDAILISNINDMSDGNITAIKTWFDGGNKLLWIGGDSDYGGYYNASGFANPMLSALGSQLRMDAGAVADPQSNDGASYRVVANETGASSTLVDYVTNGFGTMPFHGPTAVFGWNTTSDTAVDLRNTTLTGVDVVITSSAAAEALDQDTSLTAMDFYAYVNNTQTGVDGLYPMLVTEKMSTSYVVVGGEVNFDDYKFMYGEHLEKAGTPHDGMMIVDRLIAYILSVDLGLFDLKDLVLYTETETEVTTETETETETQTETQNFTSFETLISNFTDISTVTESPISIAPVFVGLFSIAIIAIVRRRK